MKFSHLQAFDQVMLTGSVSEAARRLNRSQSALSATIAQFEQSLGVTLFKRERGRLQPVPEALYLHEECREILRRLGAVQQNMRSIRHLETGELRIVSMPGPSVQFLPDLLADFSVMHPNIKHTLISRSSEAVFNLVGAQQYDLGIADDVQVDKQEFELVRADRHRFECLFAIPADHPLAALDSIRPPDLEGQPVCCLFPTHTTTQQFMTACAAQSITPNVKFVAQYFVPLLRYAERGLACALVDPMSVARYVQTRPNAFVLRPFAPVVEHVVSVITPTHRPSSIVSKNFLECLNRELTKLK